MLLETSDQNRYGFVLSGVQYASGEVVSHSWYGDNPWPGEVDDQICDLLSDLDWDGVVGESPQGYARINL